MAKRTVLQEVQERIQGMQKAKKEQLDYIAQKKEETRRQIEAADLAMKQATEAMNIDSYAEAKEEKRKAKTALDMYQSRYVQIQQQEYISEEESDKVIDSLLEYEEQLAADFRRAAAESLRQLEALLKEYRKEVADVENTLTRWQKDIHANYNTRGATSYFDEFTGQYTGRSKEPYPVHNYIYTGCAEAQRLYDYLKNEKLVKEAN